MKTEKEKKGKKYYEFFDIIKKGRKKTIKVEGVEEEEEKPTKKQILNENRILRNIFIAIGILAVAALLMYVVIDNARNFEYKELKFEIVKFCDIKPCLILYQTKFPVVYNGEVAEYNFYLRNDPRKLDNILFKGELSLEENSYNNIIINITEDLNCQGDAVIALGNVVKFYGLLDVEFLRGDNITCGSQENSIFLNIQRGNETSIEQINDSLCYEISINECEILEGTEKFMIESFLELNKIINSEN